MKEMMEDYMKVLKHDSIRAFPGNEFISIVIMGGKVSVVVRYPDGHCLTGSFDGKTSADMEE